MRGSSKQDGCDQVKDMTSKRQPNARASSLVFPQLRLGSGEALVVMNPTITRKMITAAHPAIYQYRLCLDFVRGEFDCESAFASGGV